MFGQFEANTCYEAKCDLVEFRRNTNLDDDNDRRGVPEIPERE